MKQNANHDCLMSRQVLNSVKHAKEGSLAMRRMSMMNDEMERFVEGQMTLEQYINTLQRRYTMNSDEGA